MRGHWWRADRRINSKLPKFRAWPGDPGGLGDPGPAAAIPFRPTEKGKAAERSGSFEAVERSNDVASLYQVRNGHGTPLLDARSRARFEGTEADPRAGVASGHIPGARNLPFSALYADDGTFKPVEELKRLFAEAGVDPSKPFVATCGSGVTANSLIFAAHLLGNDSTRLYDGSWSEWGADPATPKATGPA